MKKNNTVTVKLAKVNGKVEEKPVRRVLSSTIPPEVKGALNRARAQSLEGILSEEFVKFLQDRVTKGKKDSEKPLPIDFKELSKYANPAIDTVSKDIGVYNPDTIDVNVY